MRERFWRAISFFTTSPLALYGHVVAPSQKDLIVEDQSRVAEGLFEVVSQTLADLTDEVLFGDVRDRPELSQRGRSLITVAALTAGHPFNELEGRIRRTLGNGVADSEFMEITTTWRLTLARHVRLAAS